MKQFKHFSDWNIFGFDWVANEDEKGLDKKDITTNPGESMDHLISTFSNDINSLKEAI